MKKIYILVLNRFHSSHSNRFDWFEVIFDYNFLVFHQNLIFFTKLAGSVLLAKSGCANLAANLSDVNLLNSWVVI